jgi:hypothetical protein
MRAIAIALLLLLDGVLLLLGLYSALAFAAHEALQPLYGKLAAPARPNRDTDLRVIYAVKL